MKLQLDTNNQTSQLEDSTNAVTDSNRNLSIEERVNQISQQFWLELNDMQSSDFPLLGMWK